MLVLTRRKQESIHIGGDITITILEMEGDRVKVGIDAPKTSTILRGELVAETRAINQESAGADMISLQRLMKDMHKP